MGAGCLLEQAEDAGAEEGADGCGGDDGPALWLGQEVALLAAVAFVDLPVRSGEPSLVRPLNV